MGRGLQNLERPGEGVSQELLTWREATRALGWSDGGTEAAGRRLKDKVLAREAVTHKQIATRDRGNRPMWVTMSAIMRHMPELRRSRVDALSKALFEYNAESDKRIANAIEAKLSESVEPRLEELWQRDEKLAVEVEAIGKRIHGLSRVISHVRREQKDRRTSTDADAQKHG